MLKIEQQADLSAKRESLKKLSLLCHSISGLPNVYTIFIYRKRTPFSEKRPYYWLGYGLRWLCGTTIPFVMLVYDYIPLMSPVIPGAFGVLPKHALKTATLVVVCSAAFTGKAAARAEAINIEFPHITAYLFKAFHQLAECHQTTSHAVSSSISRILRIVNCRSSFYQAKWSRSGSIFVLFLTIVKSPVPVLLSRAHCVFEGPILNVKITVLRRRRQVLQAFRP